VPKSFIKLSLKRGITKHIKIITDLSSQKEVPMRKTIVLNLVLLALLSVTVLALESASDTGTIVSNTIVENTLGGPVLEVIRPLFIRLSVLFVILVGFRVYYERKSLKTLEAIRYDLDALNESQGIDSSRHRKHILHRIVGIGKSVFTKTNTSKVKKQ